MPGETYAAAGVDRDAAARAKGFIAKHARSTFTPQVLGDVGFFGSLYQVQGFRNPVLVSHTDSVGTKTKVAVLQGRYDTVGVDVVNHLVNDILTCGARPLFFLDYIGTGKVVPERLEKVAQGLALACREAGCALIGGETAELPGLYAGDDFDLVGFIVGAAEREGLIDGSTISGGDVLLGVPSSGLHTNGFSLVRRVFLIDQKPQVLGQYYPELGRTLGEELLTPHRCYYPLLEPVLSIIRGMAHITGGGLLENVPRILPKGLAAHFRKSSWKVSPLFGLIRERGKIEEREMFRAFNMGIGMVLAVAPGKVKAVQAKVPEAGEIGYVAKSKGDRQVVLEP